MSLEIIWAVAHRMATRERPFRNITSAPQDGRVIEVRHGRKQEIAVAEWSGQRQAYVLVGDPNGRSLYRVTGWRHVGRSKPTIP
jgi:hypothetical protein